jgi:hypothetical protein
VTAVQGLWLGRIRPMGNLCSRVTTESSGTGTDYAFWQRLLADKFFRRDTPVVLFIDDEELRRMLPTAEEDPAARLAAAVAEEVDIARGRHMFHRLHQKQADWWRGDRRTPPPTLPLLALTVLAASRMHRDVEAAAHNFYIRLAQALDPEADSTIHQRIRTALREDCAFTWVADMWRTLHDWLTGTGGEYGISTIPEHPGRTRIGYPLSQAILRRADRAELTRFFSALDLRAHGVPPADTLLSQLKLWMSRPRGFGAAFQEMVRDPVQVNLVAPTIVGLAEHWDGRIVTSEGLRRLEIKLVLDIRRQTARWAIVVADGVDADVLRGEVGGQQYEVPICRDPHGSLYLLGAAVPVTPQAIRQGLRLQGSRCAAYFTPTTVIVLAEDPDAGAWLSCESVIPYEQHLIAATDDIFAGVERVLKEAAVPGWRIMRQAPARQLLRGWRIFTSVTFNDQGRLDKALSETPLLRSTPVRPDLVARPQLAQGLPLASHLGRNFYLRGGEPDLLLPNGDQARKVDAALDGVGQEPPFTALGFPIPLSRIGPLHVGDHEVHVDGERLTFHILDSEPGSGLSRWGTLGWDEHAELGSDRSSFQVRGADVEGPDDQEPVLARRGQDETWLLHDDGICQGVREPTAAPVLSRVLTAPPYYFELAPDKTAVWLAQRRGAQWRVRMLRSRRPIFTRLDRQSLALWRQVGVCRMPGEPLWDDYLREWERHCGR